MVPFALVFSAKTLFLPLSLTAAVKEENAADKIQEAILKMLDLKTIGNLSVLSVIIKGKLCIVMFYTLRENPEGGGGGGGLYTGYRYFQLSPSHSSLGKVIFKVFLNVIVHDELPKLSQYFVGLRFIAFIISICYRSKLNSG